MSVYTGQRTEGNVADLTTNRNLRPIIVDKNRVLLIYIFLNLRLYWNYYTSNTFTSFIIIRTNAVQEFI